MDNNKTIIDSEAHRLIQTIFDQISRAKTTEDLKEIKVPKMMDITVYPKINFSIEEDEIRSLIKDGLIDDKHHFSENITSKLNDPISKLLFAIVWKNGDLKKVKHIINGILNVDNQDDNQESAMVFTQFGKHLSKKSNQPIIDQHIIRAFGIYKCKVEETATLRKLNTLKTPQHKKLISDYKSWLISDELSQELKNEKDYTYFIDQILFAIGKTVKSRKQNSTQITNKKL